MNRFFENLSPKWQYRVIEYQGLAAFALLFACATAAFVLFYTPEPHSHAGYVAGETLVTFDETSEYRYRVRAIVKLPDGAEAVVTADGPASAQWLASTPCLEIRQRDKGERFHRLTAPQNCASIDE